VKEKGKFLIAGEFLMALESIMITVFERSSPFASPVLRFMYVNLPSGPMTHLFAGLAVNGAR
jgi:hypothetical protein